MKELLNVNQIRKTFSPGTINEKTALADVSLRMNEGDFITIIGNNGAGKSTLLNCIAGVFPIDSGSITLDGRDITKEPEYKRARQIGRVFQDPLKGTAFDMTIEQNLAIAYYKNRPRGLQPGISKKRPRAVPRKARAARHGTRKPHDREGEAALRRAAAVSDAVYGGHRKSEASAFGRTYGGA